MIYIYGKVRNYLKNYNLIAPTSEEKSEIIFKKINKSINFKQFVRINLTTLIHLYTIHNHVILNFKYFVNTYMYIA